jgi:4-amino-4-deoxy-L-arabinose transferase-like glycosyltransferase
VFLIFFRLGAVSLFDVDEAVFAQASREMYLSGDFLTPTYNGEKRFDKPILLYWLMAGSYALFGINEFAARFPSALAGMLLVISVYLFMVHAPPGGKGGALRAAAALVLSVFFAVYSRAAVTDMTLTLFISLSLFSFYLYIHGRKRVFIYGFYFFSALAFLTKGLIGILFPFGAALIYSWFEGGFSAFSMIFDWKAAVLFAVAGLPWYVAQVAVNGNEFIRLFIIKHHFERYTGVISGHSGPLWYYLPVLFLGFFPWSAFLPSGVRTALKDRGSPSFFALVWLLLILVFFSFSGTKLPNYILPALPAAAILAAEGMKGRAGGGEKNKNSVFTNGFLIILALVLAGALTGAGYYIKRNPGLLPVPISGFGWLYLSMALMLGIAFTGFFGLFSRDNKLYLGAAACLMALFLFTLVSRALPLAGQELEGALHDYSLYARRYLGSDGVLACFRMNNPSVVFYSGKRVVMADDPGALAALAQKTGRGPLLVIARSGDIGKLGAKNPALELIKNEGGYALFEKKAEKN